MIQYIKCSTTLLICFFKEGNHAKFFLVATERFLSSFLKAHTPAHQNWFHHKCHLGPQYPLRWSPNSCTWTRNQILVTPQPGPNAEIKMEHNLEKRSGHNEEWDTGFELHRRLIDGQTTQGSLIHCSYMADQTFAILSSDLETCKPMSTLSCLDESNSRGLKKLRPARYPDQSHDARMSTLILSAEVPPHVHSSEILGAHQCSRQACFLRIPWSATLSNHTWPHFSSILNLLTIHLEIKIA